MTRTHRSTRENTQPSEIETMSGRADRSICNGFISTAEAFHRSALPVTHCIELRWTLDTLDSLDQLFQIGVFFRSTRGGINWTESDATGPSRTARSPPKMSHAILERILTVVEHTNPVGFLGS